jgi:cytolethal distending toxin subunit A
MRRLCLLLVALPLSLVVFGQGVEELRASVVKITSKAPEGQPRTGTGFIVHVDGELVYIATASHVVEGDPKPQVAFYHDKRRPVTAEIGALEGGNDKGLGFLIVRDRAVAGKVKSLDWSSQMLRGGEDVLAIGFGQGSGEWGVIKGSVASASGSDIKIDGRIEEGNSGGPIIINGSVAGMVTSISQGFGIGKSGIIVRSTLLGWDVNVSAPVAAGTAAPAPSAPPASNSTAETGGRERRPAPPSDPGARPGNLAKKDGQPITDQRVMLINTQTGKCLTIAGGRSTDNNVTALQFDCDGDPSRSWIITSTGGGGVYQISNVQTRKCLTIAGGRSTDNNVEALQFNCDSDPSRTWRITATDDGIYQISNVQTGKCLTIAGGRSTDNNVTALQFNCDSDPSRTWRIRP